MDINELEDEIMSIEQVIDDIKRYLNELEIKKEELLKIPKTIRNLVLLMFLTLLLTVGGIKPILSLFGISDIEVITRYGFMLISELLLPISIVGPLLCYVPLIITRIIDYKGKARLEKEIAECEKNLLENKTERFKLLCQREKLKNDIQKNHEISNKELKSYTEKIKNEFQNMLYTEELIKNIQFPESEETVKR